VISILRERAAHVAIAPFRDLAPRRGGFRVRGVAPVERGDESGAVGEDHDPASSS
jgi:hypothetical protein